MVSNNTVHLDDNVISFHFSDGISYPPTSERRLPSLHTILTTSLHTIQTEVQLPASIVVDVRVTPTPFLIANNTGNYRK